MADLFASPEGLSNSPRGLWPASADERLDCGHSVIYGDQVGYIAAGRGCEDCVTGEWEAEDRLHHPHGYWGSD